MLALLAAEGVTALDGVVLDLGVSSFQIDEAERGFSFRSDGPLDMRMEKAGKSAADLVNTMGDSELADILFTLGEERIPRRIARAIVAARAEAPITTTGRLASIIRSVTPRDPSGMDRATRSFQALRLAVNDELGEVERGLDGRGEAARPGRAARRRRLPLAGGPDREALHGRPHRPRRRRLPPRPRRADGQGRRPAEFRLLTPRALRPGDAETDCQSARPQQPAACHRTPRCNASTPRDAA